MRTGKLKHSHIFYRSIGAWVIGILLVLVTVVCFIVTARGAGEYFIEYETQELADALILRAQEVIKRNTRAGIDLDQMVAFDNVLKGLIQERREIAFMALLGSGGRTLAFAGQTGISPGHLSEEINAAFTNQPVKRFVLHRSYVYSDQGSMGSIVVGVDIRKIDQAIFLIAIDCLIAALVAAVIVREIAKAVIPGSTFNAMQIWCKTTKRQVVGVANLIPVSAEAILARSDGDEYQRLVAYIRLVTFLTTFSEELIRPFLSLYIGENLRADYLDMPVLIVSSTLGIFMVCWAAAQLIGPFLARKLSIIFILRIALLIMSIGVGLFAISTDWLTALFGRALTGLGFGIVLITGQAAILHSAYRFGDRVREVGNVAAAMVAAGLCGPLVGGLLADHVGYRPVLVTAFIMVCIALIVGIKTSRMDGLIQSRKEPIRSKEKISSAWNFRSLNFLIAFAIPIKIVASAVLVYLTPLTIIRDGESLTMVGRVIALYFVGYIAVQPIGNRLLSTGLPPGYLVITTAIANAVACYIGFVDGVAALAISMFILGCAHALSNTGQLNVYFTIASSNRNQEQETKFLGVYRLAERIGGIIGPPLCVLMDALGGLSPAELVITAVATFCMVATALLVVRGKIRTTTGVVSG